MLQSNTHFRRAFVSYVALSCVASFAMVTVAQADVLAKSESGFQIGKKVEIESEPDELFDALTNKIDKWWSPDHTYTGDSSNLYLEPVAKGWFGERLEDDGVCCHLLVVFVQPGRTLRLTGGLGPLQEMGVNGSLTFSLTPSESGTSLVLQYNVSGFAEGGLEPLAAPVDFVLTQQLTRLKAFVETGSPE